MLCYTATLAFLSIRTLQFFNLSLLHHSTTTNFDTVCSSSQLKAMEHWGLQSELEGHSLSIQPGNLEIWRELQSTAGCCWTSLVHLNTSIYIHLNTHWHWLSTGCRIFFTSSDQVWDDVEVLKQRVSLTLHKWRLPPLCTTRSVCPSDWDRTLCSDADLTADHCWGCPSSWRPSALNIWISIWPELRRCEAPRASERADLRTLLQSAHGQGKEDQRTLWVTEVGC